LNTFRYLVVGAGISVQAGIPDFRSPEGLFQTLKRDNPRESLASGKDLFDASVFNVSVCQIFKKYCRVVLATTFQGSELYNSGETMNGGRVTLIVPYSPNTLHRYSAK
jgi:NAD-dependent SIR2 family protein deacetylase